MNNVFNDYKPAIRFILVFVGLYVVLNTLYGVWIEWYSPLADPLTKIVTRNVAAILSLFHANVTIGSVVSTHIPLMMDGVKVINVFEGCNSANVVIVYLSFLIAFKGRPNKLLIFSAVGVGLIYLMNLVRVTLLFEVAVNFPKYLYFFHKYLFTGIIYMGVFAIWYYWIRTVRADERKRSEAAG